LKTDLLFLFCLQIDWLNKYHKDCRDKVGAMLKQQGKNDVYDWLVEITKPVGVSTEPPKAGGLSITASAATVLFVAISLVFLM